MRNYNYKARDNSGRLIRGVLVAENELDLANHLNKLGCFLIEAKAFTAATVSKSSSKKDFKLSPVEVLNITTQLAISLDSGVPLLTSLKDLSVGSPDKKTKAILEDIAHRVESGTTLKEALTVHSRTFSQLYISVVGAGEGTGKLPFVLDDLAKLLEWQEDLKSKIKEASIYPILLFVVMIGVVSVLVGVVIPKFEPMFAELGVSLPLPTQIVLLISQIFRRYWWMVILGIFLGGVLMKYITSTEKGGYAVDKFKLKVPVLGKLFMKIALSRFCHTFSLSLRAGVPVYNALGMGADVLGNKYLYTSVKKAQDYVNAGERISTSLENSGEFPSLVIRMINVGEQTGSLSEVLEKVNGYYDKEVPATIKKMFAMFEPLMIVVMGTVVGGIAISVFLPLISIINKIGGD